MCANIWEAIKKEINEGNPNLVVYHAFFSFICHSSCLMGDDGVAWEYRCIIKDKLDLWVQQIDVQCYLKYHHHNLITYMKYISNQV